MLIDFNATLVEKKHLAGEVWSFVFRMPEGTELQFTAGQYLMLMVDDHNIRQYSIASRDDQTGTFQLIVGVIENGVGSTHLTALEQGDSARFKGPAGVFTLKETQKPKVFLATGTGIAPIKSMIESYFIREQHDQELRLFFGVRTKGDVYLYDEFKHIANDHENFNFRVCLSREEDLTDLDETCFGQGRIDKGFLSFLENDQRSAQDYEYYICGSKHTVDALIEFVKGLGIAKEHIYFERFTV